VLRTFQLLITFNFYKYLAALPVRQAGLPLNGLC
jgi:hypothetical protein